ncbi:hypothetical protein [Aeromonas bivalvium]|nr:hypothetical protein [Aeromonas bivalvium]
MPTLKLMVGKAQHGGAKLLMVGKVQHGGAKVLMVGRIMAR